MSEIITFGKLKNDWFILPAIGIKTSYKYKCDHNTWEYRIAFAWMCFGASILVWRVKEE